MVMNMARGCCFTGHWAIPEQETNDVLSKIRACVDRLYSEDGISTFYAGGCTGFDTLAAQAVLEYREDHSGARLVVVVPYRDQSRRWSQYEKAEYESIKGLASEVVFLADHYFNGCMHQRNRYMVDRSSVCVCYLTRDKGGTASTVKYARTKGLAVHNLADETIG